MQQNIIDQILETAEVPLNHHSFFSRVFALLSKHRHKNQKDDPTVKTVMAEEYDELSRRLEKSRIQESTSVRNILKTRELANLIIDDKGEINTEILPALIEQVQAHLYSIGPNRQYDAKRNVHILNVLKKLHQSKEFARLIKKVTRPLTNRIAEEAIRETLNLLPNVVLTDAHTRRALLASWLSYLRQNVGSCFATAPAIMVHDEQPELFLQDLTDLISMGRLKRTFGGVEYSVPISASSGTGDLKKPMVIDISSKGAQPEIWYSPGLIAAFEATELLPRVAIKEQVLQLKQWIEPIIFKQASRSHYCIMTTEKLIREILLNILELTEGQVYDYENRPRGMIQSNLIMQQHTPSKKGLGGIGQRVSNFLYLLDVAYRAFKSLSDNALLKTWEFTLASFAETKFQFTQWNLYASLGLQTNEPGGIGQAIHQNIQRKLDELNKELQDMQYEYEMIYTQVKTVESQYKGARSEKDAMWLKVEYQNRLSELHMMEARRDIIQVRSNALVNLFESLYTIYQELFKDYFQEVYDADLHEVAVGPFDDSPAGFRLVFKHGRSNTSQWTRIKNPSEFVDALASFFVATEPQVASALEKQNVEKDLSEVVTAIINHVKTREFLETAFQRMAIAHNVPVIRDPLNNMDKVEKKPWAYTSGGTMNTLVSCYYRIPDKPAEAAKWVESEVELLVFLADTLKHMLSRMTDPFLKGGRASMLMQSPTHAFLLKPALYPFKDAWSNQEFTYTSVRDRFVKPAEKFVDQIELSDEMMGFLVELLLEKVPENYKPRFKSVFYQLSGPMHSVVFRDYIVEAMEQDRGLRYGNQSVLPTDQIDSLLYSILPLFPTNELKERLRKLLSELPDYKKEQVDEILSLYDQIPLDYSQRIMGASQLQDIAKALICLYELKTSSTRDLHLEVSLAAQKLGFSMPAPIIFADTNWVKDEFGFVVSPGTGRLELWRVDYIGTHGHPMSIWKQWVDGSRPDQKWGIYIKPYEYGQI